MRKFIFILGFYFIGTATNVVAGVTENDSLALVALYDSTNGASWTNSWDLNQPVSTWYGITVVDSNVTRIDFNNNNLSGHLPSQIGDLDSLEYLVLAVNSNLTGEIPPEIGNLKKLETLRLNNNNLTGEIPKEIGNMTSLGILNLNFNVLTGSIPVEITNCLNLFEFRTQNNQLDSIPDLSVLPQLDRLHIAFNNFSGSLPVWMYSLTDISLLAVYGNNFDGEISPDISNLQNLRWFYFGNNNFSGSIPEEIGTLNTVTFLELYGNNFSGEIPPELGDMDNLQFMRLHNNQLTGQIPEHLANLNGLQHLSLGNNQLSGTIPDSIGYMTSITQITLTNNNLEGTIPQTFSNLVNLENLYLSNNNFEGSIDGIFDNIHTLEEIYLDGNNFVGAVPDSFATCQNLTELYLGSNQRGNNFSEIPSFANHSNLQFFNMQRNAFTFEDIEPQLANTNLSGFYYSPQDSVGKDTTIVRNLGESFTVGVNVGGSQNNYQWFLNDTAIVGATEDSFTISQISQEDYGDYICEITSDTVTQLTLYSFPVTLADQTTLITDDKNNLPARFSLRQNYPNPFNPLTHIRFDLPNSSDVKIEVFNILGSKVATLLNTKKTAGYHAVDFDAANFASGVYFYRIQAGEFIKIRKMVIMK